MTNKMQEIMISFSCGVFAGCLFTPLFLKKYIENMYKKGRKELSDHAEKCQRELKMYADCLRGR